MATVSTSPRTKAYSLADAGAMAVLAWLLIGFILPYQLWLRIGPAIPKQPHFELEMLLWTALLAVALPLLQIYLQIRRFGGTAIRSNRADFPADDGMGGRTARAHRNLIESLVPFAAAAIAIDLFQASDRGTVAAAGLYLAARLVHALTYVLGITVVRSAAFYAGVVATVTLILHLPLVGAN